MFDFTTLISSKKTVDVAKASAILSNAKISVGNAEQKLGEMRRILNEAIVDSQLGDGAEPTKARAAYDKAQADLTFARTGLEAAEAIHRASMSADELAQRAAKIKIVETEFNARDADAQELSVVLEKAVSLWRSMLEHNQKAENAGLPLPLGLCTSGALHRALTHEIFRLGHDPIIQGRSFPGGESPSIQLSGQPLAITPLAVELQKATSHVLATLRASRGD